MPEKNAVLEFEDEHHIIRLYDNLLRIDLKGSFKNEIEEALENKPILKETIGSLLGVLIPLHIRLLDIKSVHLNDTGKIKINLPFHRNIVITIERKNAEKLVNELTQLISRAKKLELERTIKERRKHLKKKSRHARSTGASSYVTMPYYFPTEQVDVVNRLGPRKKKRRR